MPFIMGVYGFGGRNVTRDGITVVGGTLTYETSNLPTDSASTTSARGSGVQIRCPWHDGQGSRYQPTGQFWCHFRYTDGTNNTANDVLRLGVGRNGTELFCISTEDTTHKWTLRVAGQLRATAASAALSLSTWHRLHLHVSGYAEGDTIRLYVDGDLSTPVVEYTFTSTDESNIGGAGTFPNEFWWTCPTGHGSAGVDDFIAFDPSATGAPAMSRLIEPSVKELLPNGNGSEQDWGGSYADIDERPASDTDKITATAVGQEATFTFPDIAEDNVFGVKLRARVTRTGTDAGANLILESVNGADDEQVTVAAPGDGDVQHIFQTAPDGNDWSPTSLDATEFGFIAET